MDEKWGHWTRHYGQGMPVQAGTVGEAILFEAIHHAKGEVIGKVRIGGIDPAHHNSSQ